MRRFQTLILALTLSLTLTPVAWAEAGGGSRAQGEQLFRRGVALIDQERWEEGLEQFEESYRLYPTQAALFNRALCLRLLRRYGEALSVLAEYRTRYASQVSAERMAEVDSELRTIASLVGRVRVALDGADSAEIYVDGQRAGTAPGDSPIVLGPGRHTVELRAAGFRPFSETVTVESGEETQIRASLVGLVTDASVSLNVNVSGARVALGGTAIGTTPLSGPIPVASGTNTIEVTRPGYVRSEVTVRVEPNETASAEVILRPMEPLPPALSGELALGLSHDDAQVLVDGQPWAQGPVPIGPHRVEVRRQGMQTWSEEVEVRSGATTELQVALQPDLRGGGARERNRPLVIAGFVSLGVGVAVAVAGVGVYAWNLGRRDVWGDEDVRLRLLWVEFNAGSDDYDEAELLRLTGENADLLDSCESTDVASWVLIGVGAALAVASIPLLVLGYRGRRAASTATASIAPTPGGLAMSARFAF